MQQISFAVAGSLAPALSGFVAAFTAATGLAVALRHGPAGLLTAAIRDGEPVDVFVSASPDGPESLHRQGLMAAPQIIALNHMVLVLRPGLDAANDPLTLLADPRWRIGMSTPGSDPSGDYAAAFLQRLTARNPQFWQPLHRRCHRLYGATLPGPGDASGGPALAALRTDRADVLIAYATTRQRITAALPGTRVLPLPPDLAPPTRISATLRPGAAKAARDLFEALSDPDCQRILHQYGFLGPAAGDDEPAPQQGG